MQPPAEPLCVQGYSPALAMANSTDLLLLTVYFRHQNSEANSCFLFPLQKVFEWDPITQGEGPNTEMVGGSHHSWGWEITLHMDPRQLGFAWARV